MSEVFTWDSIPKAHTKMLRNQHLPGNMAALVCAPVAGLRTIEDAREAFRG
jgi:crotonyl-CoA carboxylase/reductase